LANIVKIGGWIDDRGDFSSSLEEGLGRVTRK
jgi:hypothetical protein